MSLSPLAYVCIYAYNMYTYITRQGAVDIRGLFEAITAGIRALLALTAGEIHEIEARVSLLRDAVATEVCALYFKGEERVGA